MFHAVISVSVLTDGCVLPLCLTCADFLQAVPEDKNGKLKVYLRVRPLKSTEVEKGEDQVRQSEAD